MIDWYVKTVLTVIALCLLALVLRDTETARAQGIMNVRIVDVRPFGIMGEIPVTVENDSFDPVSVRIEGNSSRPLRVEVVD